MNTIWAKEKLEAFISAYGDWSNAHAGNRYELFRGVIRRTHTVIKIIETLGLEAPEASDVDDEYFLPRLGHVVTTALGLLDDWDELDKNLRPTAPAILADQLHPWVWDAARTFWESKHYRAAVHQAASSINAHLQDKLDRRDTSDDRLVSASFSEKGPDQDNPRLRVPGDPTDQTVRSIQYGAGLFAMGCFQVIRNPAAHEHDDWPQHIALERLAALSVLARLVDESRVARWGVSELEQARRSFFERVLDQLGESYPAIGPPRTKTPFWWSFAPGSFGYYAVTFSQQGYRVEIYLDTGQKASTKALFDDLYGRRAEIAQRLGFELDWERLDDRRASRIACYHDGQLDPLTARPGAAEPGHTGLIVARRTGLRSPKANFEDESLWGVAGSGLHHNTAQRNGNERAIRLNQPIRITRLPLALTNESYIHSNPHSSGRPAIPAAPRRQHPERPNELDRNVTAPGLTTLHQDRR